MASTSPPKPGEISLAHGGVLFLDELPEFKRQALEALREPLETGRITLSRAARQATYPAEFVLVAALNPCPCGMLGAALARAPCRCSPDQVARYRARLSGPLMDRIDLQIEVNSVPPEALTGAPDGETSAVVAQRVQAARERQLRRQGVLNARLAASGVDAQCGLDAATTQFLHRAAERLAWSGRALHRVLRVARTLADLADTPVIGLQQVAEAIQLRRPPAS